MPLYEDAFCPVCNRKFEEGDDIVYCPECGTPHHRECYKAVGHCVNKGLHASGYSYRDEMKGAQSAAQEEQVQEEKKEETQSEIVFNPFIVPSATQFEAAFKTDKSTIDGESIADFATTIRTNIPRFIKVFTEFENGKKFSWNWGAFFFGSLYLFFRKMYKHAIAFFCAFIAIVYANCYAIMKFAPKYVEALKNFANLYAQNKATTENLAALAKIEDISKANLIVNITLVAILVLRVVAALFADKFYKKTIADFIKSVNAQLKDGASFIQTPMFPTQSSELDQQQMKSYYLARRGGTSFFLPILAASAGYFLISMAMSMLYY